MPSAAKGDEREIFVREFLGRVFPPHFRFGTGCITDRHGGMSGQVNVVVELPFFPSLPVPPSEVRMYLADGVAVAIEVKSDIAAQWNQLDRTVESIKTLRRNLADGVLWRGPRPFEFVPVFAVGYSGFSSVPALLNRLDRTPPSKRPEAVLVLDDPGVFIAGTKAADGAEAMLLFLGLLNNFCTQIVSAGFDVQSYVTWEPPGYFDRPASGSSKRTGSAS